MSDTWFNIIKMSSLPESYWPTLQTITASNQASKLSGLQLTAIKADDIIACILEEAQHCVINDECTKIAKSALAAWIKKPTKSKGKKKDKSQSDIICNNCHKPGHGKPDCYSKGGGKEGKGPCQRHKAKAKEFEMAVVATDNEDNKLFIFTCMSEADNLDVPKSRLGTCINSGASWDYCPDCSKFLNYKEIHRKITTACYKFFSSFTTCRTCFFYLLFFIYDQHAFTSRQTCLSFMFTSFLHYVLHVFTSRLTHSFIYLNQVVRQLYSLAFH